MVEYRNTEIKQDKTSKSLKYYTVIFFKDKNPQYSKVLLGGSVDIIKRKIDRVLNKYEIEII